MRPENSAEFPDVWTVDTADPVRPRIVRLEAPETVVPAALVWRATEAFVPQQAEVMAALPFAATMDSACPATESASITAPAATLAASSWRLSKISPVSTAPAATLEPEAAETPVRECGVAAVITRFEKTSPSWI